MAATKKAARFPPVQQNLIDKAIAYFAPRVAGRRLQARTALALAGGYSGAKLDRAALAAWQTSVGGSPESDVIVDLPMLRDRSADLERNSPIAASVINTSAVHVVGTGLSCNPHLDAEFLDLTPEEAEEWQADTRRRYKAWAESPDCDLARVLNFYGIQDQALRGTLVRGDIFAATPRVQRSGNARPKLAIQLIEADRCCNPERGVDTATLTAGIEHDENTGEAIVYHFASRHPDDFLNKEKLTWKSVRARGDKTGRRNVIHLFKQLRPGLRRGVPILAPVIEPLKQFTTYTTAELQAAVTSGLFSVFVKMDPKAFESMFDEPDQKAIVDRATKWSGNIESGQAVNLLPGEEIQESNPGRPNSEFDNFTSSCLTQIGMALGIPREVLTMSYSSSYSAARGALLHAWRFFLGWRDWLATNLCQPVYEIWLADQVANGLIAAPGFFADDVVRAAWCSAQWVGDGPGSIDPQKEVKGAADRIALGISTLQAESVLHDGVDWETKHRQSIKESQAREEAGLPPPGQLTFPTAPAAAAPEEPADPNADEEDDPPKPPPSGEALAMTALAGAVTQLATRPAEPVHITVQAANAPAVTLENHVQAAAAPNVTLEATVEGARVDVLLEPRMTLEANVLATLSDPNPVAQEIQKVVRDAQGEIVSTTKTLIRGGASDV